MTEEDKVKKLAAALLAAKEHLGYCGYGDRYERECARDSKLEQQIDEALACVAPAKETKHAPSIAEIDEIVRRDRQAHKRERLAAAQAEGSRT